MIKVVPKNTTQRLSTYLQILFWVFLVSITCVFLLTQIIKVASNQSHGAWGIFHYFIGAKYIKEIGYFDLYSCALKVNSPRLKTIKHVRNLYTYEIVSIDQINTCPKENFSKERWSDFTKDIILITSKAPTYYWEGVFTDKGFNPPPFWTFISSPLANIISIENPATYLLLFNIDLILIFASSLLIYLFFGKKLGFLTLALSLFYFGTFEYLTNNYLQYLWFPLLTCAFICWKNKKYLACGIFIGVASGLQIFPIIFSIPFCILFLSSIALGQKELFKISSQFLFSCLITLTCCVTLGGLITGRISIWQDWYKKISIHREYTKGEIFNIGLTNLTGTLLYPESAKSNTYIQAFESTTKRTEIIKTNRSLNVFVKIISVIIPIILIIYSRPVQPLSHGYIFLYTLLTLSPYYYLAIVLMPVTFWNNSSIIRRYVIFGIISLFLLHHLLFWRVGYITFGYFPHLISELSFIIFFVLLYVLLLFENKKYFLNGVLLRSRTKKI